MVQYEILFEEPYELEILAHREEDLVDRHIADPKPYRSNILWGYKKGIDYFFEIFWIFKDEMGFLFDQDKTTFVNVLTFLAGGFLTEFKEKRDLDDVLVDYIDNLKKYKFITYKPKFPFKKTTGNMADYKEVEITTNRISKMIINMRQHRIEFYEVILQEYLARKEQYNQKLKEFLKNEHEVISDDANNSDLVRDTSENKKISSYKSVSIDDSDNIFYKENYELNANAFLLREINPTINKYEDLDLEFYRSNIIWGYKDGIDNFFTIFYIFKQELDPVVPKNDIENCNVLNRTLTVLLQFLREFEEKSDLQDVLLAHIEQLEKFSFLTIDKNGFVKSEGKDLLFDRISRMIYDLRHRRIEFYEALLQKYLAKKAHYNQKLKGYLR